MKPLHYVPATINGQTPRIQGLFPPENLNQCANIELSDPSTRQGRLKIQWQVDIKPERFR
jgi:hypothetical protein